METLPMFFTINAVKNQHELKEAEAIYHHIQSGPSHYLACVKGSTIVNDDE